jgi:hypothetical protein
LKRRLESENAMVGFWTIIYSTLFSSKVTPLLGCNPKVRRPRKSVCPIVSCANSPFVLRWVPTKLSTLYDNFQRYALYANSTKTVIRVFLLILYSLLTFHLFRLVSVLNSANFSSLNIRVVKTHFNLFSV